ncbi:MAG TPA: endonuclease/exonuclease/phosphatase family protein [Solirubrobacteraceae bacterium]|nr:endonuclease/exonuclease/phosphatase family protein [Solirubrobacteraceae bacterium]
MRTLIAWLLAAVCAGWAVMRAFGLEQGFPLVPLISYTPFVVALAAAVVVLALVLRRRGAALVAALAAVALAGMVAPRALGGPTDPDGDAGAPLRVLTVNMHYGTGSAPALVELVRATHPDVLSVQELTPDLVRRLDAAGLGELLPHYVLAAEDGAGGTGLYARGSLTPTARPATVATMASARLGAVDLVAVHTQPPLRRRIGMWDRDLRSLPAADPEGVLRILAGDFNATLDHAELRRLIDTGYEDAAATVGAGLRPTWPQGRRIPPPVTIDHVLADKRCGVREVTIHTIPGTDHRAVFAALVLPQGG